MISALPLLLLLGLAHPAHSLEPYSCRNGGFPSYEGEFAPAVVAAASGSRVHFRDDVVGCPEGETCIQRAYLVDGDNVLLSHREDRWACAWYFGKKREFVGWLPQSSLRQVPRTSPPKLNDWIGTWSPISGENVIHIADNSDGYLRVNGSAIWYGGTTASGDPIVHMGDVDGIGRPKGSRLMIGDPDTDHDCVVRMQLVSNSLVVSDNSYCGGMNVRFDDVYRKRP